MPGDTELAPIPERGKVVLVDKDGSYQYVAPELAHDALKQGYKLASAQQIGENIQSIKQQRTGANNAQWEAGTKKNLEDAWGGHGSLGAGALGYVSGFTGGLGPTALAHIASATGHGDVDQLKQFYSDTQKAHPTASTVGEVAGFTGAVVTGEGLVGTALGGAGIKGASTVAGRIGQTAARGAVENAAFGAQHDINESMLENKPLVGEHFIADRGLDLLVGGAFGGVLHGGIEALGAGRRAVSGWVGNKGANKVALLDDIANETATRATGYSPKKFGEGDVFKEGVKKFIGDELLPELPAHKATKTNLFKLAEEKRIATGKNMEAFMGEAGKEQKALLEPHIKDLETLKVETPILGERLQKLEALPEQERLARAAEISDVRAALEEAVSKRETLRSVENAQVKPQNIFDAMEAKAAEYEAHPYIGTEWEGVAKKIRNEMSVLQKQIKPDWGVDDLWQARSKYDLGVNRVSKEYRDLHAMPFEAKEATRQAIEEEIRRTTGAIAEASPGMAELPTKYTDGLKRYAILSELGAAGQRFADSTHNASVHSVMKGALLGGFGGAAGGHGILGAVIGAVAEPILEQQARERSALLVAKALKRISTIDALKSASAKGTSDLSGAIRKRFLDTNDAFGMKIVKPVNIRPPRLTLGARHGESDNDAYLRHTDEIKKLAQDPREIERRLAIHTGIIHENAPETAGAIMDHAVNAVQYLAFVANSSSDGRDPHSPTSHLEARNVSGQQIRNYSYAVMGVMDPKGTIDAMLHGTAPKQSVKALQTVWPQMYKQTQDLLLHGLAETKKPLSASQRRAVTGITGVPAGYSQTSSFIAFSQELHGGMDNQEEQNHAAGKVRKTKDLQRPFETTMQSLAQK